MIKHLIIHTSKDMKIKDWTPFENKCLNTNMNLIHENQNITNALDTLSNYGWRLKNVFTCDKEPHFMLQKKIERSRSIDYKVNFNEDF